jgi:hypothetical protein
MSDFDEKINVVLKECNNLGYELKPFYTIRTPQEQARLWRQSRTITQINRAAKMLRDKGALLLSELLIHAGPQYGRWATNALPGQSWHQYGEAVDCFVLESGRAVWNSNHPGYYVYAKQAMLHGLEAGHFWVNRDSCHIQKQVGRIPYSWPEIEKEMVSRFKLPLS